MKTPQNPTYISLFSSSGIGCYGFTQQGFDCVATNELVARRLDVQRYNNKCKYQSGYIDGDISSAKTKTALRSQIALWKKKEGLQRIDVVIATPPCQGMSVANHKKSSTEIVRNSLVVESIKIIKEVNPRFFIFENVPAFMKTVCTDIDGRDKEIAEAIESNLGKAYSYASRIINFKDYGACSSRQRTLVIGVSRDYADEVSPLELYPELARERTLREVIGGMKPLKGYGEIDEEDIYHSFRPYPEHMRAWIADIKEGESAFDNPDDAKKPHQILDGQLVINQQKNGDKYRRQYWDKVGPCIHTRNDQLASQNTIHPSDDRVFSIRELMRMMTVPDTFRWVEADPAALNALPAEEKRAFLKKEEIKIRQSLGEAVPTAIFRSIAGKIGEALRYTPLKVAAINKLVQANALAQPERLKAFVSENPMGLSPATLCKIAELASASRTDNAAFFTSKSLITEIMKALPDTEKQTVHILEPSVGVGNFIPLILKKFEGKHIILDVVDIDPHSLALARLILKNYTLPKGCEIRYIEADFLLHTFEKQYDYIIGNPPFFKMKSDSALLKRYLENAINPETTNICSFFLDKAVQMGEHVAFVFPKFLLNTPEFARTRGYLMLQAVEYILDFGEKGFPGVLVETMALVISTQKKPDDTHVVSITQGKHMLQKQCYIFDKTLPYWIIYRDEAFDTLCKRLDFDVFDVFRDRQITNKHLSAEGDIRVLKSRNISDDGKNILDIKGYDAYISHDVAKTLAVYAYYDCENVYLTPNMTMKPRVMEKPRHCLVNGSVAILIPKDNRELTAAQVEFFSSPEYRGFYQTARNYQTRSLNVDATSVFFYGLLRDTPKEQPITETLKRQEITGGTRMLTQQEIVDFCTGNNYDIRSLRNARWIDQKCAADVVTTVADCIREYSREHAASAFSTRDIWHSDYAIESVEASFKKPGVVHRAARHEYDKFFQQPMEMLAAAGVLNKYKKGNRNYYQVNNHEVLEFIAFREKNTLFFLKTYIEKTLRDSEIYPVFQRFFETQTKEAYEDAKDTFAAFTIEHTKINGPVECNRIFIKVLNPLAYYNNSRGTEAGKLSKQVITYDMLMYNRSNFKDIYVDKPKGVTRKEYAATLPVMVNKEFYSLQSKKAKKFLRRHNEQVRGGQTEHLENGQLGEAASEVHHIFPAAVFPEISYYSENLIVLTPSQHMNHAHPKHTNDRINKQYQRLLLLSKADRIREDLLARKEESIYEFSNLLYVLSVGFDNDDLLEVADMDFDTVVSEINKQYENL